VGYRIGKAYDRGILVQLRAVPWPALRRQSEPKSSFLPGLQQVRALAGDIYGVAADLADRVGDSGEYLRVFFDHPCRTELAARLFVGEHCYHDVARGSLASSYQLAYRRNHHGVAALHVDGAATENLAVAQFTAERVEGPILRLGGHDIEVAVKQQGRRIRVCALPAGD
jgi:hypothetical protein